RTRASPDDRRRVLHPLDLGSDNAAIRPMQFQVRAHQARVIALQAWLGDDAFAFDREHRFHREQVPRHTLSARRTTPLSGRGGAGSDGAETTNAAAACCSGWFGATTLTPRPGLSVAEHAPALLVPRGRLDLGVVGVPHDP